MSRITFEPSRMIPADNARFQPCKNAKQTTEVFCNDGRVRMQIKRESYSAQELIQ